MIRRAALAVTLSVGSASAAHADAVALQAFGRCVVKASASTSTQFLAAQPGTRAEALAMRRLTGSNSLCMGKDSVSAPTVEMRGAIAEALLVRRRDIGLRPIAETPIFEPFEPGLTSQKHHLNEALYGFGQCVVTAQPVAVRAMVVSTPASEDEKSAFRTLRPALGPCLPNDAAMKLDRTTLRAILAESLYMLTSAETR